MSLKKKDESILMTVYIKVIDFIFSEFISSEVLVRYCDHPILLIYPYSGFCMESKFLNLAFAVWFSLKIELVSDLILFHTHSASKRAEKVVFLLSYLALLFLIIKRNTNLLKLNFFC